MTLPHPLTSSQLLSYASDHFDTCAYLNGNDRAYPQGSFPNLLGMGAQASFRVQTHEEFSWNKLDRFLSDCRGKTVFVQLSYDLKHHTDGQGAPRTDDMGFPLIFLFVPHYLFQKKHQGQWEPCDKASEALLPRIRSYSKQKPPTLTGYMVSEPQAHFSRERYMHCVHKLQQELSRGNIYEINFCNSYSGTYQGLDPVYLYEELNRISPMPFSAFFKEKEHVVISASPERFLKKEGKRLTSQPIKGTAGRKTDPTEDAQQRERLAGSLKERTENIMIVDLVRNDLSRICDGGTVHVEELCRVYTFEQVHQMISTIHGTMERPLPFSELLKALFPMGSMTGAPKHRALQLIDELEQESRGLFSGSVGYISPDGDFDLNVIIRSLLLNEGLRLYRFHAGSAITVMADAEQEYQECLVKTRPMLRLFEKIQSSNL